MITDKLMQRLEKEMDELTQSPNLFKVLEEGFATKELYAIYLIETYHYTKHNAKNQALVAARRDGNMSVQYMKYCFKHALEETGHELMAIHDIKNLGYDFKTEDLPKPLSSTENLVNYLYEVAEKGNPIARLGYSFWAERSYEFIAPLLFLLKEGVGIPKRAMTFFNEHSEIDETHAIEVNKAIESFAKTDQDKLDIEEVMVNSLMLTSKMLDEVLEEFINFKENKSKKYDFLR